MGGPIHRIQCTCTVLLTISWTDNYISPPHPWFVQYMLNDVLHNPRSTHNSFLANIMPNNRLALRPSRVGALLLGNPGSTTGTNGYSICVHPSCVLEKLGGLSECYTGTLLLFRFNRIGDNMDSKYFCIALTRNCQF